jgi:spore coat polysaccharide biosynthesis protein SpsF
LNKKTKVVGVIQARMGSTRLPKKMLLNLGNYPIIEWVIRRAKLSKELDKIVLATSNLKKDDKLAEIAKNLKIDLYRGSEVDVLERFCGAADMFKANTIVRICADNPFIDSNEINRLITFYFEEQCDYACNHQDRLQSGYVDGLGAEIFSKNKLDNINKIAIEPKHREHITLYFWDNYKDYKIKAVKPPKFFNYPNLRFDVDTKEDLDFLNSLIKNYENIRPEDLKIKNIINKLI